MYVLDVLFLSKLLVAHKFSGISNDVQAMGGENSAAAAISTGNTINPGNLGYVINTATGPKRKPGPAVQLPGHVPPYGTITSMQLQGGTMQPAGYTAEHATYPVIRHERIREAYSTHHGEVVVVEVRLVVKLPGKVKEALVHVRPNAK